MSPALRIARPTPTTSTSPAVQYGATMPHPDRPEGSHPKKPAPPRLMKRFLVIGRDTAELANELARCFDGRSEMTAAIVLDLRAIGQQLFDRAGVLWFELKSGEE